MSSEISIDQLKLEGTRIRFSGIRWWFQRGLVLLVALLLLGSSGIPARIAYEHRLSMTIAGQEWDLVGWELDAIWEKLNAVVARPADDISPLVATLLVKEYLAGAARMGEIERELARRASLPFTEPVVPTDSELIAELTDLRTEQQAVRPQVEQVIERMVSSVLDEKQFSGLGGQVWPPVSFTFVEPPKKLVVSRRDRIETVYSRMLDAAISLAKIEEVEAAIREQHNSVGYITDIGGLGAFPTMVVDRASLRWVLSTVAHEWAHNYLVFFPLGWNYFTSQELTTINETVAEIVGNEIGDLALARYFPDLVPSQEAAPVAPPAMTEPVPFDFQTEMRQTRLEVDRLLEEGDVAAAEAYMEERRLAFVENGYPLRVLNQAYFAFHGSYGTSPSSTSPIGPNLVRLRELMPDLKTFLEAVRGITSVDDLNQLLLVWERSAVIG